MTPQIWFPAKYFEGPGKSTGKKYFQDNFHRKNKNRFLQNVDENYYLKSF